MFGRLGEIDELRSYMVSARGKSLVYDEKIMDFFGGNLIDYESRVINLWIKLIFYLWDMNDDELLKLCMKC